MGAVYIDAGVFGSYLVSHVWEVPPDDDARLFSPDLCSLMDEGEFTRLAIQGGPLRWVKKVEECIKAANRAGEMLDQPVRASLAGWMVHQLISGILIHSLPRSGVIDYGVSHEELAKQVVCFCGVAWD